MIGGPIFAIFRLLHFKRSFFYYFKNLRPKKIPRSFERGIFLGNNFLPWALAQGRIDKFFFADNIFLHCPNSITPRSSVKLANIKLKQVV